MTGRIRSSMRRSCIFIFMIAVISMIGYPAVKVANAASPDTRPLKLVFHTSPEATFPQAPLWAAVKSGRLDNIVSIETRLWKNLDDLRGVVLAGKGDLWLGSTEVFARSAALGAPVTLLAVTGWRKFYLLSRDPKIKGFSDLTGRTLPYAPRGAPAAAILDSLKGHGLGRIELLPYDPGPLSLMFLKGRHDTVLLPEPLVTSLLDKDPKARVVMGLAEEYGRLTSQPYRLPLAGLAVNSETLKERPEAIRLLAEAIVTEGRILAVDPEKALAALPSSFTKVLPRDLIKRSLVRDLVLTEPAWAVENEIDRFLHILDPALADQKGRLLLPDSFIWRP